jgi:AAA family ATP:ADP antiporter
MGSALSIGDNALNYSINQSARESLYTAATRDEKYKAKAFIDMFVQRFAKAVAVGVSLLVTALFADYSAIRWLSLASISLGLLWLLAARHAGRRFAELAEAGTALAGEGRGKAAPAVASGRGEARTAEADARGG